MFANLETARYATVNVNNFAEKCLNELLGASNQLVGALFQYYVDQCQNLGTLVHTFR